MPVGKKEKVLDAEATTDQVVKYSAIANVLNYARFAIWIKNLDVDDIAQWQVEGRFDNRDPDSEWEVIKAWADLAVSTSTYWPQTADDRAKTEAPWDAIRIAIRRKAAESNDPILDAWINRKRH